MLICKLVRSSTIRVKEGMIWHEGFTLLEVMIALAILSIALIAVLGLQSQAISIVDESSNLTIAAFLAKSKMAELEANEEITAGFSSGDFGEDFPGYRWEVEITSTRYDYLKKIVVTVRRDRPRMPHPYTLILYKLAL